jgi:16S rRNA G527 N7-methylase RsmG
MLRENLLELESDLAVRPSSYCMTIDAFKAVVKHYGKEAPKYLAYIYFKYDPRSSYMVYDESTRKAEILRSVFKNSKFEDHPTLRTAIEEYSKNSTSAQLLLEAAMESVVKLKEWLKNLKTDDEDYDALKHMKILGELGKTINGMKELEDAVKKEVSVNDTYGNVQVNRYNE